MFFRTLCAALVTALVCTPATAANKKQDAEACMSKLIKGYEKKKVPGELFAFDHMLRNIAGRDHTGWSDDQFQIAQDTLKKIISESFATSKNRFSNIKITGVKRANKWSDKVVAIADIWHAGTNTNHPKKEVTVFVTWAGGCGIYKVVIENLYATRTDLRQRLYQDPQVAMFVNAR